MIVLQKKAKKEATTERLVHSQLANCTYSAAERSKKARRERGGSWGGGESILGCREHCRPATPCRREKKGRATQLSPEAQRLEHRVL